MNSAVLYSSEAGRRAIMSFYDAIFARWPMPYEEKTVPTRYGDTFVIACGDEAAPPLVLLHGASSNAVFWLEEAANYSRNFRVYAVDIIGEPGRSAPSRPPWKGAAHVEWLQDVLAGLGVNRPSVLGISEGGWIALKFAVNRPDCVEKLVLLAPGGIAAARPSFFLHSLPLMLLGRRGAEAINRIVFGDQPVHPDALKYMNAIMTHFKLRVSNLPIFSDAELRGLSMPVLLMVGERDAILPSRKMAGRLERLIPGLKLIFDPVMGHVLFGVSERVTPFLQS